MLMFNYEFEQVRYYSKHAVITETRFLNKLRFSIVNIQFRLLHDQMFIQSMLHHYL